MLDDQSVAARRRNQPSTSPSGSLAFSGSGVINGNACVAKFFMGVLSLIGAPLLTFRSYLKTMNGSWLSMHSQTPTNSPTANRTARPLCDKFQRFTFVNFFGSLRRLVGFRPTSSCSH